MSTDIEDIRKGPVFGPFIFLIDKDVDETSFDVIRKFKRLYGKRLGKIGHLGTLDPFATGLLIIGIGGSTRLNQYTEGDTKEYEAIGILGQKSPTGDLTCEPNEVDFDESFSGTHINAINEVLNSFIGPYEQAPHAYSAAKVDGKKLYEYAREGKIIKKDKVLRHIHEIELKSYRENELHLRVVVSHGTYIRVLMEEIAERLGTFGVLKELRRTKVGDLSTEDALKSSDLNELDPYEILRTAKPVDTLLKTSSLELEDDLVARYSNGQRLKVSKEDGLFWVVASNKIYGLGKVVDNTLSSAVNFQPAAPRSIDLNLKK